MRIADWTGSLATINYHLAYFGENLSKIDQAIDLLEDLIFD